MSAPAPESFHSYNSRYSFVALVGLLVSGYLTYHHTEVTQGFQIGQSFCSLSAGFDCEAVARSSFAKVFGIPVSFFALGFYVFVGLLVVCARTLSDPMRQRRFGAMMLALAVLGLIPSIGLLLVSMFVLKIYCLLCLVLDVVNVLLVVLALRAPYLQVKSSRELHTGLRELFSLALPFPKAQRLFGLTTSLVCWLVTVLGIIGGRAVEEFLVVYYFTPRAEAAMEKAALMPFVENWRAAPSVAADLPIQTEGSGMGRDYMLGDPAAVLTIVGFSDYECPFCKLMAAYVHKVVETYPKEVRYVFKDYPLDMSCNDTIKAPKHQYACLAAKVARCAGIQREDFFWKAHDKLYNLPWITEDVLTELGKELGLDEEAFTRCLESADVQNRIVADVQLGKSLGVKGTPTIFVNGKVLTMVPPKYFPGVVKLILDEIRSTRAAK